MPVLKNPRHERFAQLLANGKSATDAYAQAGYTPSHSNGAWLARKEEISSRVAELNREAFERERATAAAAAERAAVTRQGLIEMAQEIRKGAIADGQWGAAVAATKEIGVLAGIRIERSERGGPGEFDWLDKLSVEELKALADGKLDIASYRQGDAAASGQPRKPSVN
jgi:phage terminase small subunit